MGVRLAHAADENIVINQLHISERKVSALDPCNTEAARRGDSSVLAVTVGALPSRSSNIAAGAEMLGVRGTPLAPTTCMVWCFFSNCMSKGKARCGLRALKSELYRPIGATIPT
jgi:hypothetical protein